MSILVKGMKMPSCCEECPLMHEGYLYGKFFPCVCNATDGKMLIKPSEVDMRDGLCPLVEIPEPHGDLIDRDALRIAELDTLIMIRYKLAYAPTVIEAEGRKDGENHDD